MEGDRPGSDAVRVRYVRLFRVCISENVLELSLLRGFKMTNVSLSGDGSNLSTAGLEVEISWREFDYCFPFLSSINRRVVFVSLLSPLLTFCPTAILFFFFFFFKLWTFNKSLLR